VKKFPWTRGLLTDISTNLGPMKLVSSNSTHHYQANTCSQTDTYIPSHLLISLSILPFILFIFSYQGYPLKNPIDTERPPVIQHGVKGIFFTTVHPWPRATPSHFCPKIRFLCYHKFYNSHSIQFVRNEQFE
jgi:hypothetical protein